jgi:phosphohistidine phosphatase SixA
MTRFLIISSFILLVCSSCSHSYYVFRHAEKANQEAGMSSDVPLSDKGKERAKALPTILRTKKIGYIYSTNTIRTKSTAQPAADRFHLTIETYGPRPDSAFISLLKTKNKSTMIVGHSNTIDDIVNMLCGEKKVAADLPDNEYNKYFVVKKRGKKFIFSEHLIYRFPAEGN